MNYFVTITPEQGRKLLEVLPDVLEQSNKRHRAVLKRLIKEVEGIPGWLERESRRQLVLPKPEAEWLESISQEFDLGVHVKGLR